MGDRRKKVAAVVKKYAVSADNRPIKPSLGGLALSRTPSVRLLVAECAVVLAALGVALLVAPQANWNLALFSCLIAFAVISDLIALDSRSLTFKISGSSMALVLAIIFLGAAPAAIVGLASIVVTSLAERKSPYDFLINVIACAVCPLIAGVAFYNASVAFEIGTSDAWFYLLACGALVLDLALNLAVMIPYTAYVEQRSVREVAGQALPPIVPSEFFAAVLIVGIAFLYIQVGLPAIALCAIMLLTFQYMLGQLLLSEDRAEALEFRTAQLRARTRQLGSLQVGVLSALMHTLDLRDRMTARHSAAVARYAREIAIASGCDKEEQDLVHTAGLLHDIGKFVFPDSILKGDAPLTEDDWNIIRMHPFQGAKIVSDVEGYGPVGEIVMAHHERIDGEGYPRGLEGDDIPKLSRMISVADTYDVMTARDSYRKPMSSFEAIQELKRVAGKQLDGDYVELFIQVLAGRDVRFRHGEDADFDAELGLEKRVEDYAFPEPEMDSLVAASASSNGTSVEVIKLAVGEHSSSKRSFAQRLIGRKAAGPLH